MAPQVIAVMIPIIAIISGITMIILLRRYEHVERLNMIERGMNPADIKTVWRRKDPYRHLRIACTAIGIGLGFLTAGIYTDGRHGREEIYFGTVILFGGIGLLIGYGLQIYLQNKAREAGRNPFEEEI